MFAARGGWCDPETGAAEQHGAGLKKIVEGGGRRGLSNHKYQIVARHDRGILPSNGFAHPALDPIPVVRLAELFSDHKPAAGSPGAITRRVQQKQRVRPGLSVATHPLKLFWSLQPLASPHAASRLPMAARYASALVAHRELPSALQATRLEHLLALAGRHARKETMLAAARDSLGLPRSLWHEYLTPSNTKN